MDDQQKEARARARELGALLNRLAQLADHTDSPRIDIVLGDTATRECLDEIAINLNTLTALIDSVASLVDIAVHEHGEPDEQQAVDTTSRARRQAELQGWMEGQNREALDCGTWTAAAVAKEHRALHTDITDLFDELDHRAITKEVLDDTNGSKLKLAKTLLLDEWFGEIADAYADEDGEL